MQPNLKELYKEYIDEQRTYWAPSTIKSEEARAKPYLASLMDPVALWSVTSALSPYARKTLFIRANSFFLWLQLREDVGQNPFPQFMKRNFRFFSNAYVKKPLQLTFEEVSQKVLSICDKNSRELAQEILRTGLRYQEHTAITGEGTVVGKGGKTRPSLASPNVPQVPYNRFYYQLVKVGLTPHMLRKAALSKVVDMGASTMELMTIAGWSNLNTAQSYIAARQSRVNDLLEGMRK